MFSIEGYTAVNSTAEWQRLSLWEFRISIPYMSRPAVAVVVVGVLLR
jgi:hypothetical protein